VALINSRKNTQKKTDDKRERTDRTWLVSFYNIQPENGAGNWNSLPAHLRDNSLSLSSFKCHLKTFLFSFY